MASGGVGFTFLRGAIITVLASHRIVGTVGAGLGVGFVLLLGFAIVILARFMLVETVSAGLFDGGCVTRVKAMSTFAGVLGADSSRIFGTVIYNPKLACYFQNLGYKCKSEYCSRETAEGTWEIYLNATIRRFRCRSTCLKACSPIKELQLT